MITIENLQQPKKAVNIQKETDCVHLGRLQDEGVEGLLFGSIVVVELVLNKTVVLPYQYLIPAGSNAV